MRDSMKFTEIHVPAVPLSAADGPVGLLQEPGSDIRPDESVLGAPAAKSDTQGRDLAGQVS